MVTNHLNNQNFITKNSCCESQFPKLGEWANHPSHVPKPNFLITPNLITMKALATLCLMLTYILCSGQSWIPKSSYPGTERDDGTSFIIGNKAYCGTGLSPWFSPLGDFYSFNVVSQSWNLEAPLPGGLERQYATGFSDGYYGFVFGGIKGNHYFNDLWRYDPGAMTWTQLTSLPDSGRSGAAGFHINYTLYIIGGKTSNSSSISEVWAYDIINDSWTKKSNLPEATWRGSATATDSIGFLAFGINEKGKFSNNLWEYDPSQDVWHQLNDCPGPPVSHSSLQSLDGYLLAFGGVDSTSQYQGTLYRYDIQNSQWTQLPTLPSAKRKGGMAFTHGQDFYYTTGIDGLNQRLKETWACENVLIGLPSFSVSKVELYPNPISEVLNVKIDASSISKNNQLTITDLHGKVWIVHKINGENHTVETSLLPQGLYFATLKNSTGSETFKLLKAH